MKRSTRVWIGGVAAVATFASLVAFVGMRHNHWRHGMMNRHNHCSEQCYDRENQEMKQEKSKTSAEAPGQTAPYVAPKQNDSPNVR